jgi:hypothetical protein
MALLKNCEVHYVKCDPKHPNANFNKKNPTWEVQIRTTSLEQKKEWDALGLKPKLLVGKEGSENEGEPILTEDGKKQWRVNLKKKSITKDGDKASPVKVVNGGLEDIDPNTVGNGSVANVRIYQYEFTADGKKGLASVLMAMQLKKHIVYTPKARDDDFEMEDTETINPDPETDGDDDGDVNDNPAPRAKAKSPAPKAPTKVADERPEAAF